ncbi:MAG: hypothetical protein LBH04_00905 [Tannerellaceae bacterium]|jgi:hypothetical protein|nr:hypothetical protein [Tannerellaceae bacterium]
MSTVKNGVATFFLAKMNDIADKTHCFVLLRKIFFLIISCWTALSTIHAQTVAIDNQPDETATALTELDSSAGSNKMDGTNIYSFFINIANESFTFPLIGFVNVSTGNSNFPQIGFVNSVVKDFKSVQTGFINTVGGNASGLQLGFVNTVAGDMKGVQCGFINTAAKSLSGSQLGFVNTAVERLKGPQIAFVNAARRLSGLQLGFINYVDSIEKGIPVGFLSFVRKGGYNAVELGISDMALLNLSYKFGVKVFYSSLGISYNPFGNGVREQVIDGGAGFGSIIELGKNVFFNPEITSHSTIEKKSQHYISLVPGFGYNLTSASSLVFGPSLVWASADKSVRNPFYYIVKHSIDASNILYVGARIGIRFNW